MPEVLYDALALAALERLEADATRSSLAAAVNRVLDDLGADPADPRLRRHRFQSPPLWYVPISVAVDGEPWALLWEGHPTDPDAVIVQYLGPASFA